MSLAGDFTDFPLSDISLKGRPRLDAKHLKLRMNEGVSSHNSDQINMYWPGCAACVPTQQVM